MTSTVEIVPCLIEDAQCYSASIDRNQAETLGHGSALRCDKAAAVTCREREREREGVLVCYFVVSSGRG